MKSWFGNWTRSVKRNSLLLVLSILLPTFGISHSVMAAEKIYASYSLLEVSFPVISLEVYAKTGLIDNELAVYQRYISLQQLQELRPILLGSLKISPAVASQFLYTQPGEFLVRRLAELIKTKSSQSESGLQDLRLAIILASGEPEGLTLLNLLRKYPSSNIHINLADTLEIFGELEKLISQTNRAIALVQQKSHLEVATIEKENLSQLPNLPTTGKFQAKKYTIKFFDFNRNRLLLTDVYLPNVQHSASVIVISHGLGLDSSNFRYLANHLASQGFAVVVPNHPNPRQSLIKSKTSELVEPGEFTDRPLDIKYILDQLETANQFDANFKGRLNLQQVGVFGQSFGGYTALALAGARINFEQLKKDCTPAGLRNTWNMSLMLQCQALELPTKSEKEYNLRDERVKAAIAVNPITSSIFGQAGLNQIQTPVMLVGSSEDTVAPTLAEQILPFSWLTNPQKYLVLLLGGTHFSTIGNGNSGSQQVALPAEMVGDAFQARAYIKALSLPFFQAYVAKRPQYLPYLNADYAKTLSTQSLGLSLVQSLSSQELSPVLDNNFYGVIPEKKLPSTIIKLGFWILDIGVSLLHVMIFL
ncbi:alpha/beta hydrolase [Anabaena lutea]|uniref:Alpha/beta hydrolase n=1 Tax=Anabaena lutea FACHB-196 TaxID=2692881 RepID=A0ABR8FFJ3_9NOST|nr:alpha/beta hydrolase [Anabaena lutea]MBD2567461.1 alpha/beta hydrolase [Anabaena lutea FACHB-196]